MKRIVTLLLIWAVCLSVLPLPTSAQETYNPYTDAEKESIYLRYLDIESDAETIFGENANVSYQKTLDRIENETIGFFKLELSWALDAASYLIGEYPDKQDYTEILANLMTMQSSDLAEQIQNQSQYDDLKDGMDYFMDAMSIVSDMTGVPSDVASIPSFLKDIAPIIDAVTGGAEVLIENGEQAKYYAVSIGDYVQSRLFLEAICKYADNKTLREVASSLLPSNHKLLEKRLEYLKDSLETSAVYQAKFFLENLSFKLLKETNLYKNKEIVKWFVDGAEKGIEFLLSVPSAAFKATILRGDILYGTSDTFNRYQEMKIVSDIADAIVKANHHVQTPSRYDSPDALNIIQTKCNYYKMLIVTHARGEYLIYQLLINDAGRLSDLKVLFDAFKEPGKTTESWYNKQVSVMLEYYDILNNIFVLADETETTTDLGNVPQEATEFNGHFYYIYNVDTGITWKGAKQYCESQGGYLVTITSPEEQEFISELVQNQEKRSYWIGLTDEEESGVWRWVTDEPFSYSNWGYNEPNHGYGGKEHYVAIVSYDTSYDYPIFLGEWNDHANDRDIVQFGFICEWESSASSTPPSENHYETDSALGKYLAAAAKTTETGSWSEQLTLEADMSIAYEGGRIKTKMTLTADSDVSNYVENDLSQIEISSLANMKVMGQTYSWSTEYYDGVAHYEYTEPFQQSQSLKISPDFFNFEASVPEGAILTEEVSGNQIRFVISGKAMTETGIAAVQQISGVNNLEYEDVEVIATLSDTGSIEQVVMNFDAAMEFQGYDADVTYKIQYAFR